jgi:heme-degrading monooxygenase HmoA
MMIVTVFRSRLRPGHQDEYGATLERMRALAVSMSGYISHKTFTADDGERVTIVEFESEEALRAWRMHPEHRAAQKAGRDRFYLEYSISSAEMHPRKYEAPVSTAAAE